MTVAVDAVWLASFAGVEMQAVGAAGTGVRESLAQATPMGTGSNTTADAADTPAAKWLAASTGVGVTGHVLIGSGEWVSSLTGNG